MFNWALVSRFPSLVTNKLVSEFHFIAVWLSVIPAEIAANNRFRASNAFAKTNRQKNAIYNYNFSKKLGFRAGLPDGFRFKRRSNNTELKGVTGIYQDYGNCEHKYFWLVPDPRITRQAFKEIESFAGTSNRHGVGIAIRAMEVSLRALNVDSFVTYRLHGYLPHKTDLLQMVFRFAASLFGANPGFASVSQFRDNGLYLIDEGMLLKLGS
ncbi:hypothetical protein TNIN_103971 [Trichonephila inaurata madagascariensis]|uniref:Uncharacterized protein n=1 Tax=Trichonephila inaurata madagascariensis TaxID=2747483 RepID=A0A8X7BXG3_9ARAC|nr:hypothetical protein TNIN_103971 [Trichonephila inaurata madagascariensis]